MLNAVKSKFQEMATFPDVIGCVDCTHVPIIPTGGQTAEQYRNRKGYFSLKIQVVAGPQLEILDAVIRWPRSTHD